LSPGAVRTSLSMWGTEVKPGVGMREFPINMSTAGGGCIVDTPEGLVLVEEGVKKQVVAPRGSEMYTPGLFIQDDPHGLAMLGAGLKTN